MRVREASESVLTRLLHAAIIIIIILAILGIWWTNAHADVDLAGGWFYDGEPTGAVRTGGS